MFLQAFIPYRGTPKITFHIPRNSTYENVYRPEEVESVEGNWIAAELLPLKVICRIEYMSVRLRCKKKWNIFVSVLYYLVFLKYQSIQWKWSLLKHQINFSSKVNTVSRDIWNFGRYLKNVVYFSHFSLGSPKDVTWSPYCKTLH
jgi:hypothetical protein